MPAEQIEVEPPVGNFLANLLGSDAVSDVVYMMPPQPMRRAEPFAADHGDPAVAQFAPLFEAPEFRDYTGAALFTCRLHDARLLGSDAVLTYAGRLLRDTLYYITYWTPGSVVADYRQAEYLRLRGPLHVTRVVAGDCMIGFTASWRNYAHWLQETLPKLFLFRQLRRERPDLRIVLPALAPGSFQQQTLDLLGIGPASIETVLDGEVLAFDAVTLVSNVDLWGVPPVCAAAARDLATCAERVVPPGLPMPPRVYIHRVAPPRQVANFAAVRDCVQRHGFTVVSFEGMRLAQQIATMRDATLVIGEHGAGLGNLLFAARGARVLELFNPACVQPAFWSLASACGFGFGFLIGEHAGPPEQPGWNTDYVVPLPRLEAAIAAMTAAMNPA